MSEAILRQFNKVIATLSIEPVAPLMCEAKYKERVDKFLSLLKNENEDIEISQLIRSEEDIPKFVNDVFELFKTLAESGEELISIPENLKAAFTNLYARKPTDLKPNAQNIALWKDLFEQFRFGFKNNLTEDLESEISELLWNSYLISQKQINVSQSTSNQELSSHFENYSYQVFADKLARLGAAIYKLFESILEKTNFDMYVESEGKEKLYNATQGILGKPKNNEEYELQKLNRAKSGYTHAQYS